MPILLPFTVAALQAVESNFAPVETVVGSNRTKRTAAFDDTTEEYRNGKFVVPSSINGAGVVTFRAYVWSKTVAASRNVALRIGHHNFGESGSWDVAYVDEDIDDQPIDATQDDISIIEWTETVAALGWTAEQLVGFRISRFVATTTDLVGDMYWDFFAIEIPT
jgi:hypothetical protein